MITAYNHRTLHVLPALPEIAGRYLVGLLLLLLPMVVHAQEEGDSIQAPESAAQTEGASEDKGPKVIRINFTPEQAMNQARYNPRAKDSLLSKVWWKRLYAGLSFGQMGMTDNVDHVGALALEAYLGYKFSPISSLRVHLNYTPYRYTTGYNAAKGLGVGIDYMANLTNYILGNSRTRYFDAGVFFGAGVKFVDKAIPNRLNPYFRMGAHAELHLSKRMSLFVEPYVGLHRQTQDLYGRTNPEPFSVMYGFGGGLQIALDERDDYFVSADSTYRDLFVDVASGISIPGVSGGLMNRAGSGYQVAVGKWVNPMMGFRLGIAAQTHNWSAYTSTFNKVPMRVANAQTLMSGRLELMLSPLNFIPAWRAKDSHVFDVNVLIGGDYGWNIKGGMPDAPNGFHCYYYGFTGALQGLYRINRRGTYLFVEPRFLSAMYSVPYANTPNSLFVAEKSMSLSLGTRVYITNPGFKAEPRGTFIPNWWIGADFGGVKLQHGSALHPQGDMSFNPAVGVQVGFEWKKWAAFRAQVSYQKMGETTGATYLGVDNNNELVSGNTFWDNRYDMLDVRLAYMLNINNMLQGFDLTRKFNLWLTAGPSVTMVMGEKNRWVEGQEPALPELQQIKVDGRRVGRVSPGLTGSVMASMEVARNLDVTLEAMGQYNFISGVNPGVGEMVNNMRYGFSVGTRYHVSHRAVKNFFKGEFADPWHKGWFFETSGGWAFPINTGNMLRCGGSTMNLAAGYWWNNLLGARLGLNAQQSYWNMSQEEGQREPVSGIYLHTPYTAFRTELSVGGRLEFVLNPLNFFAFRKNLEKAPKWDMNVSLGMNLGVMCKAPYGYSTYYGLTTSAAALYRISNLAQLFLEPRFDIYSYNRFNEALQANQTFSDRMLSVNFGTRISRPLKSTENERRARVSSMLSHRGFWGGFELGGSKVMEEMRATTKSFSFSPSVSATVGYNFTRLHGARAQVAYERFSKLRIGEPYEVLMSGWQRTFHGNMESTSNLLDIRLLYMLNISNLWTGYDRRVPFNLYLQAGPVVSTILSENVELAEGEVMGGTDFTFTGTKHSGKFGAGLAAGAMASYALGRHWDVTAEMLAQYYFGQNYLPNNEISPFNGIKLHFGVGMRYNF